MAVIRFGGTFRALARAFAEQAKGLDEVLAQDLAGGYRWHQVGAFDHVGEVDLVQVLSLDRHRSLIAPHVEGHAEL
jgi:hypothetical protein